MDSFLIRYCNVHNRFLQVCLDASASTLMYSYLQSHIKDFKSAPLPAYYSSNVQFCNRFRNNKALPTQPVALLNQQIVHLKPTQALRVIASSERQRTRLYPQHQFLTSYTLCFLYHSTATPYMCHFILYPDFFLRNTVRNKYL